MTYLSLRSLSTLLMLLCEEWIHGKQVFLMTWDPTSVSVTLKVDDERRYHFELETIWSNDNNLKNMSTNPISS